MGLFHVVLTTPESSPTKPNLSIFERQQVAYLEKLIRKKIFLAHIRHYVLVEEKYVQTSRLLQTNCTVIETAHTSMIRTMIWNWTNTRLSRQNDNIYWVALTCFSSRSFHWLKQLFLIKTNFVGNACSFSNEHFLIVPRSKISLWTQKCW